MTTNFPQVGDLVRIRVETIDNLGAHVKLLDYANTPGFMLRSESRKAKVNYEYQVRAKRVDPVGRFIDLEMI